MITGDIYGAEPHSVAGEIILSNLGGNVPWISCDIYDGSIIGSGQQEVLITFNTDGLEDGDYYCDLIIRDNFQHETIIPVHLLVDTYLSNDGLTASNMHMEIFPNPFNDETNIHLSLTENENVSIRVTDLEGRTVAILVENQDLAAGKHNFKWQAGEDNISKNGMYLVIIDHGNDRKVQKVIRY